MSTREAEPADLTRKLQAPEAVDGQRRPESADLESAGEEIAALPALAGAGAGPSAFRGSTLMALQGRAGNHAVASMMRPGIQRAPDGGQQSAITSRADSVAEQARTAAEENDGEDAARPTDIDPAEKARARSEQQGNFAQPDKVSGPGAKVDAAASQARSEVAKPAEPVAPAVRAPADPAQAVQAASQVPGAEQAASAVSAAEAQAQAAVAGANALVEPEEPRALAAPPVVEPLDADGFPLPVDPAGDAAVGLVASRIAFLRNGAHQLGIDATSNRARALALQAGFAEAHARMDEAEGSIGEVKGHVAHRRTVVEQAGAALDTSKQKATTVAEGAPQIAGQADEGQEQSSPMATEAGGLASTAAGAAPDDEEAAAKSREQSGQITEVGQSLTTIDSAVSQTGDRAEGLQAEAAQAMAGNAASEATIGDARSKLTATDAKLDELTTQNESARSEVDALMGAPAEIESGAQGQEGEAAAVLATSLDLESRLHAVQETYGAELAGIQGPSPRRPHPLGEEAGVDAAMPGVQRAPAAGERERVTALDGWAKAITGDHESDADRTRRAAAAQARQQEELAAINAEAGGDFSRLDTGQKAGLALRLTFSRTFSSLGDTNWPKFGADMLRGFIDPRVSLGGVLTGLGMILSGGANLFSAEQWARDPLGNLLKSAADIATGVTVVLGSIAGLAVAIIAISAALILVTFGFASPVCLPVISICSTIAATVGPWAVTAAEVALVLNGLVFIKNLIDAATASTAQELQRESQAMGEDVNAMGMAAMQIAGDRLGKAVGPHISGAMEGVQGRLAASGNAAVANLGTNLGEIGAAMAAGEARAASWRGEGAAAPPVADAPDAPASLPDAASAPADLPDVGPVPESVSAAGPDVGPDLGPDVGPVTDGVPAGGSDVSSVPDSAPPADVGPAPEAAPAVGEMPPELSGGTAANDNAVPAAGGEPAMGELPPELAGGTAANDNAMPGPEANEQVLAATGTDDVVVIGPEQPKLTVIEGGAIDPNTPQATGGGGGSGDGPTSPGPSGTGTVDVAEPGSGGSGPTDHGSSGGPEPDTTPDSTTPDSTTPDSTTPDRAAPEAPDSATPEGAPEPESSPGGPESTEPSAAKDGELTDDQKWAQAEEAAKKQEAAEQAAQSSGGAVAETFDTPEAAIGQVEGPATVVDRVRTENPALRNQGYTETWYVLDSEGTQWTVHRNPRTGKFTGAHHSSSN
jgi:hypothetical protein